MKRAKRFSELIRRRLFLFLAGALALAQWRCGENPLQPEVRGPNEVWITSSGFDPATLNVTTGTTVTWINKDNSSPHSVDSGQPGNPADEFDRSGNLKLNDAHSVAFRQRGTFNYYCSIHGSGHPGAKSLCSNYSRVAPCFVVANFL